MLTSILASSAIFAGSSFGGTIAEPPPVVEDNTNYEEFGGLVTVSQGDRYYTDKITCTISYVSDDYAFTAAHCVNVGESVTDKFGTHISHVGISDYRVWAEYDWAVIELGEGISAGENKYSGDTVVSVNDVEIGDEICKYGAITKMINCGTVIRPEGNPYGGAVLSTGNFTQSGDSGGVAWITGKGYLGVHSGRTGGDTISITAPALGAIPAQYF